VATLVIVRPLTADTRGKLTGVITDQSSAPIPGVNVVLSGTTTGTATDISGYYVIMNIPPATYEVRISAVGYQSKVIKGVRISSGQTTTLNETLSEEVVQGKEVVVVAERPIVDTRQTSAVSILNNEQIAVLPVQNLQDIVNLQAGVVDGHFRGGRLGEVQYQVDGVSVNNPLTNESTVQLDRSVLQEVQVISGTFDAEYGQAMSGVVNAVLRSGRSDAYEWSVETYLGDNVSFGVNARFPHLERINPLAYQSYQATVSGPLPLPKTTFLLSARRYTSEGYLYGERRFNPTDTNDFNNRIAYPTGDNKLIPMQTNDEWSGQFKISNSSISNLQMSYQAIFNLTDNKPYRFDFRLNPDGVKTPKSLSLVHGVDLTYMMSEKTFVTLNIRQNHVDYKDYKYADIDDPRYYQAGAPKGDPNYEVGAIIQGVELGRYTEKTDVYIGKAAITTQATSIHLLKAGVEVQWSDITYGVPGVIIPTTVNGVTQLLAHVNDPNYPGPVRYTPLSIAAYVQDRIEWKDVMVRGGLRLESFDANTTIPGDLQNPANSIIGQPTAPPKKTTVKTVLAPRLGVSYPIFANGSVYFSYGHFYQLPAINKFFSNSDYSLLKDLQSGGLDFGVMGNANLKPEFTTQYEFGMKSQMSENFGVDASLFYKDIRDLLGVEFIETYNTAQYTRLTNVDFGGVSGITIALEYRNRGMLSATLDYTYQNASGNSSDPSETAVRASAGEDPRPRVTPFAWDQRHTINGSVTIQEPNNFSVTSIVKYGSGQPYTPTIGSGFGADLENNSGVKPSGVVVDLRGEKYFALGGGTTLSAFIRVYNVFSTSFFNGFVFANTGSPDYSLTLASDRATLQDPGRFYAPRRIELGISIKGSTLVP
ncbi:MAG TPA: TonB-dependent receptor, partial [Bacteroidota bacterium]|nr:TonB-dependent receptor [Bacteroidota bacterium]